MRFCLPVVLAGCLLSPALAQTEAEPPPLSGPEVAEQRIEGVESGFSSMMAPGRMVEPVPMPVFRRAVGELGQNQAPDGAKLTQQQRDRLRAIHREHGRAVAAFRRQHAEEFRQIREAMGPQLAERLDPRTDRAPRRGPAAGEGERRRRAEGRPDRDAPGERDGMRGEPMHDRLPQRPISREDLTDAQRAAIARLRELRALAPGPEALQTKVWAELTEAQRAHVQARIDEHRTRMAEQRQAAYVERMAARRAADDPAAPAGPDRPVRRAAEVAADLAPELRDTLESLPAPMRQRVVQLPPQRLEQLLQRLSRLEPEERAQVLRRLQQDRRREGAGGNGERRDRRSPPPLDRVNVPDPKDK